MLIQLLGDKKLAKLLSIQDVYGIIYAVRLAVQGEIPKFIGIFYGLIDIHRHTCSVKSLFPF